MERKIIVTGDNSKTLLIPDLDETYHSTHGALNEARHVFIKHGLAEIKKEQVNIFELGFGTGLNLLVTMEYLSKHPIQVNYSSIEKYPLPFSIIKEMGYDELIDSSFSKTYLHAHESAWEEEIALTEQLTLLKQEGDIKSALMENSKFHLILFDAFGPRVQPDLWSVDILFKMYSSLKLDGRLVTYCAQGQFKRNLKAAGFKVYNVPGPPGKREMTIGLK